MDAVAVDGARRSRLATLGIVALVLASLLVIALGDAGLPFPAAIVLAALAICMLTVAGFGVVGYRTARENGRGVVRSIGSGIWSSARTLWDLF